MINSSFTLEFRGNDVSVSISSMLSEIQSCIAFIMLEYVHSTP